MSGRVPLALAFLLAVSPVLAASDDAIPLSSKDVAERWHRRLATRHFSAHVRMQMDLGGLREERVLKVHRDDEGGDERVLIRFDAPPDLRNVGLLYLEHAGRPNDYFLYQPAMGRIRRLPQSIADDDVYGIDLEFLGFGVAQSAPTEITAMTRETLNGRAVYKLEERATVPNTRFESRRTWVDAQSFVPWRTEHLRGERVVLVAETLEVGDVQGVATPRRMRFAKPIEKREVLLHVDSVDYEAPIPEEHFSALALLKSQA
ncbi:MAG: outer membrane lipoprotein-sorting protein, partial [Myxococcota bacterium]